MNLDTKYFQSCTVNELKKFLGERDVTIGTRRKPDLVRLAVDAAELDLEVKSIDADAHVIEKRRIDGCLIDHPSKIPLCSWTQDFRNSPAVSLALVFKFIREYCDWEESRVNHYRRDKSWLLHKSGHVQGAKIAMLPNGLSYIQGTCTPTTRLSAQPYTVWILLRGAGDVLCGECTCTA